MKYVLCINIGRPEAKEYEYITYWLISSRIANCFELTATLTYEHDRNHQFYIFGRQETCMSCKLKTKFSELLWVKKTHINWIH